MARRSVRTRSRNLIATAANGLLAFAGEFLVVSVLVAAAVIVATIILWLV